MEKTATKVSGTFSRNDHDGFHFECGEWHIWEVREGYRLAKLYREHYQEHETWKDLKDALAELCRKNRNA